ncbi:HNH endonuclease [Sphingobium jiangsuense]|uniref:HNH endonuclease n=1 Tax=Sphingobium jiangsuense TaxID=870476 RepID=UPI00165D91CA
MDEIWKPAPGYERWIEVSDQGRVRSFDYLAPSKREGQPTQLRRGRILTCHASNGYHRVDLKRLGKIYRVNLHRLVAQAFVDGEFPLATVDHINGDRTDNRAANLRWVSRSENSRLQNADGRCVGKGEKHPGAKLRDADIPEIFRLRRAGWSLSEVARQFGVSIRLIHSIEKGEKRVHAQPPAAKAS